MSELVKRTGKNNKDVYYFSPDGNFALLANDKNNTIAGEDVLFIKQDYIENIQPDSPLYRMIHESDKSKGQIKKATDKPVDYGLIGYKYYKKLVSVSDKYTEKKNNENKKKSINFHTSKTIAWVLLNAYLEVLPTSRQIQQYYNQNI